MRQISIKVGKPVIAFVAVYAGSDAMRIVSQPRDIMEDETVVLDHDDHVLVLIPRDALPRVASFPHFFGDIVPSRLLMNDWGKKIIVPEGSPVIVMQ